MRRNLFWKLALAFLALLLSVLLAVDFFAERALRRDYEHTGFEQLLSIARIAQAHPPQLSAIPPQKSEELSALQEWTQQISASGARVTVIAADGLVLADSQSDPQTMENHAGRPEIVQALAQGSGRSIRHSVTINRDLVYLAVRQNLSGNTPEQTLHFAIRASCGNSGTSAVAVSAQFVDRVGADSVARRNRGGVRLPEFFRSRRAAERIFAARGRRRFSRAVVGWLRRRAGSLAIR